MTYSTMESIKYFAFSFCLALMMLGCTDEASTDGPGITVVTTPDTVAEVPAITYGLSPLPSPLKIGLIFQNAGLDWADAATFPANQKQRFLTSFDKQLALGVYSADFTYSSLNGMKGEAENYFMTLQSLANDIGIGEAFNTEENMSRIRNHIDNLDSVQLVLTEIHMNADRHFQQNSEENKAYVIFAGAWLEAMYLGATTRDLTTDPTLLNVLLEQGEILKSLNECLTRSHEEGNTAVAGLMTELQGIDAQIDVIVAPEGEEELVVKKEDLNRLVELIVEARRMITKEDA